MGDFTSKEKKEEESRESRKPTQHPSRELQHERTAADVLRSNGQTKMEWEVEIQPKMQEGTWIL